MPIRILEIHHCAIRIRPDAETMAKDRDFYANVLGLHSDPGRPDFPDLPGAWLDAGENAQLHLMAFGGRHPRAIGTAQDPTLPHVAFAVEDIVETQKELRRMNVPHWMLCISGELERTQIFVSDHSGNLLELHQVDTCRCTLRNRRSNCLAGS